MQTFTLLAKKIKLLILDIDGVCTDGKLFYNETGETFKAFHVHDGLGIKLLLASGVHIAVISARESATVIRRMQGLGVQYIFQGYENKVDAYKILLQELNLKDDQVAYLGDDLPDLPLIKKVGLGMCVANANEFLKPHAKFITKKCGGNGAVRETCELIMQAQGTLETSLAQYTNGI